MVQATKTASKNGNGKAKRMATRDVDLRNPRNVDLPVDNPLSSRAPQEGVAKFSCENVETHWARFHIIGVSPGLLVNGFTPDALETMAAEQEGRAEKKSKKALPPREPERECLQHTHICKGSYDLKTKDKNLYGFDAVAFKKIIATLCYSLGLTGNSKIELMRYIFVNGPYRGQVPLLMPDGKTPSQYELLRGVGYVRDSKGVRKTMLLYRPLFPVWTTSLDVRFVPRIFSLKSLTKSLSEAGMFCGIGAWTNERGGPYGLFRVDPDIELLPDNYEPPCYR